MNTVASASNIGPSSTISAGDARKLANAPWPVELNKRGETPEQARARMDAWENDLRPVRKPAFCTILNIGHFIGGLPALSRLAIEIALYPLRAHIISHTVQQSSSEPTSVIVLDCYLSDEHLMVLCDQLHQDAIACYDTAEGEGRVVGPRANAWGPFNPDFFLFPEA